MITRRRLIVSGSAFALAGCGPKPVVFDRSQLPQSQSVALLTPGFPNRPDITVQQRVLPVGAVPLVGLVVGAYQLADAAIKATEAKNRAAEFERVLQARKIDPRSDFHDLLVTELSKARAHVTEAPADKNRTDLIKTYPNPLPQEADVVLDVVVSGYGFLAVSDQAPFVPTFASHVRLVQARTRTVLMEQTLQTVGFTDAKPDDTSVSFDRYADIAAAPDRAVGLLHRILAVAAMQVAASIA